MSRERHYWEYGPAKKETEKDIIRRQLVELVRDWQRNDHVWGLTGIFEKGAQGAFSSGVCSLVGKILQDNGNFFRKLGAAINHQNVRDYRWENEEEIAVKAAINQQLAYILFIADHPQFAENPGQADNFRKVACVLHQLRNMSYAGNEYKRLHKGALAQAVFMDILTKDPRYQLSIPDFNDLEQIKMTDLKGVDVVAVDLIGKRLFLIDVKAVSMAQLYGDNGRTDRKFLDHPETEGCYFEYRSLYEEDYNKIIAMLSEKWGIPITDPIYDFNRAMMGIFHINMNSHCRGDIDSLSVINYGDLDNRIRKHLQGEAEKLDQAHSP